MPDTLLDILMRANAARTGGDPSARAVLPPGTMPFVITCMDPRLIGKLPEALGLHDTPPPKAQFAGGVVKAGDVAGLRSVLAAAIFNMATEVLIIGHTDCRMGKTSSNEVRSGLQRLGVRVEAFGGEDPVRWLGAFASERSSVQASVDALRADPRMPARMPVHGLLYHLESGRMEVVAEGYAFAAAEAIPGAAAALGGYRPGPASLEAPPAPSFGAGAYAAAPALGAGPMPSFPSAPAFVAPPPPPVPVPPRRPLPPPKDDAPPPPPPPPRTPRPPRPEAPRPSGGDSPFDRAQQVLDRLRRERE